jgi:glycosyltransferase involved in cell wall biosynthesis
LSSTSEKNKTCAVIPFYNEAESIAHVINRTLNYVDTVIAVNDGSTDNSFEKIPESPGIIILTNPVNSGKGYALSLGLRKSIEIKSDFTITLDADLQHPPEFIPQFLEMLNNCDIVIGNRLGNVENMPLQRIMSNKITSFLMSIKTRRQIKDSQCGYRGFRTSVLNDIMPLRKGYEAESEMIIKASRNNLKIDFVRIPAVYGAEKSKIKPVQTIYGFLRVLFI